MSSPKFERVKQSNPRLSDFLDRLVGYINAQIQAGQSYIIPKLAAAALHLTDAETVVLLEVLTKGDILQRIYNVYCRENHALLTTVDNIDALDNIPHCDDCDIDHDPRDLQVQIAYRLKNGNAMGAAA
jgi:uncharacterized FlgJ-related protein